MADVPVIPKVRCDNCGHVEDKAKGQFDKTYSRPRSWGSMRAEGRRNTDSYGGKDRLDFADLCPKCAGEALDAAAAALKKTRAEGFDGPTGAE